MGGGGGGWPADISPMQAEKYYQETKSETEQNEFNQKVCKMLDDYLVRFNDRNADDIQKKLEDIKKAIQGEVEGTVDLRYGGSIDKHTYVDGLSDIDSLVILNKSDLADKTPERVKDYFLSELSDKLKGQGVDVSEGKLAVTVKFKDGTEIQLLPAIRTSEGVKIPSVLGNKWSSVITPQKFAEKLTDINTKLNGKVVPTIKLIKAINSQFSEQKQMTGYHIESLAIEAFKSCNGNENSKELLSQFFGEAKELVKTPIKDKSNQSIHVDDYLGKKDSESRKLLSYQLDFIYRKINNANNACSEKMWQDIFGDV